MRPGFGTGITAVATPETTAFNRDKPCWNGDQREVDKVTLKQAGLTSAVYRDNVNKALPLRLNEHFRFIWFHSGPVCELVYKPEARVE